MTETTMNQLITAAEAAGLDVRAYRDYSGRGMFGEGTFAVVVNRIGDLLVAACEATRYSDDPDEITEDLQAARMDSLGHDLVVY